MAKFDEAFFDSGARFDEAAAAIPKTKMSQVKLELQNRDDADLRVFAAAHKVAMVGNASFTTPDPVAAVFDPSLQQYSDALDDVGTKEAALATAVRVKNEKRAVLETNLTARGAYVQRTSGGVASKITSAAFEVRADAAPTTTLPQVGNLRASAGDDEGEVDLAWDGGMKGARGFIAERREDVAGSAWEQDDGVGADAGEGVSLPGAGAGAG